MTKRKGDTVELGDTVGHPTEPYERFGRVVGIRKDNCKSIEQFVVRMFKPDDSWFPTGEYRTTWFLVAYTGDL